MILLNCLFIIMQLIFFHFKLYRNKWLPKYFTSRWKYFHIPRDGNKSFIYVIYMFYIYVIYMYNMLYIYMQQLYENSSYHVFIILYSLQCYRLFLWVYQGFVSTKLSWRVVRWISRCIKAHIVLSEQKELELNSLDLGSTVTLTIDSMWIKLKNGIDL